MQKALQVQFRLMAILVVNPAVQYRLVVQTVVGQIVVWPLAVVAQLLAEAASPAHRLLRAIAIANSAIGTARFIHCAQAPVTVGVMKIIKVASRAALAPRNRHHLEL